jgi:ketosteroid isomerase-like protein
LGELFAEDVVWHVGGSHPLSGDKRGRRELLWYFQQVREMTGGTLQLEPESILASDEHIAMFTRVTGERNGRSLDVLMAQALTVGADGRFTEYWALADDQAAVDAFWS